MASEGPTTTGSINATLKLNADEFEAKIDEAAAKADALDGRDIKTKITVDSSSGGTGQLTSDLEKVVQAEGKAKTATDALAKARRDAEVADNNWRIAQLNLEKVEKDANSTEQQLLAARNRVITTTAQAEKTEQALAVAVKAAGAAENDAAGATDKDTKSKKDNADAGNGQVSVLQAIVALSPALLGATSTLAAATVGLGVAFVGMGAAGALAIKGIKDSMQSANAVGNTYATGLATLHDSLDKLSRTAAVSLLDSFGQAVQDVEGRMPFLNQFIGEMGSALGTIGGGVLNAVLTGLQQMMPLIETGAVELGKFVGFLMSFAGSDGFNQFISYAQANLPQVTVLLENIVTLAVRLLEAFAPIGPVVIDALNLLIGGLNSVPLPVLAGITTGAIAAGIAFKVLGSEAIIGGLKTLASAIGLTGVAMDAAVPLIGVLVGGMALLTMNSLNAADAQRKIVAASQDFADAVKKDNDAIGENVRLTTLKKLIDDGTAQAIQRMGLSLYNTMDAITGNQEATARLNSALDTMQQKVAQAGAHGVVAGQDMQQLKSDIDKVRSAVTTNSGAIQDQVEKQKLLKQYTDESTQAQQQAAAATQQAVSPQATLANQLGITISELQLLQVTQYGTYAASMDAANGSQAVADATQAATTKMQAENDAAGLLKQTLDLLNGNALSAAQAQNTFDSQLANMGTHVNEVGKNIQFTTANIGDMSSASVALRGQLNSQVAALQGVVEANGGLDNSTTEARAQMEKMRQQIIDNAVAHGVDRDAVTAYIDKILQIPASVPPTKIEADTSQAENAIANLQNHIDSMRGKVIDMTVAYSTTGTVPGGTGGQGLMIPQGGPSLDNAGATSGSPMGGAHALGGWISAFAYGGHVGYLAAGGIDPLARGTDTVRAMLTPGEFVVPRASAAALNRDSPGALEYIRSHGTLPPQGGNGPVTLVAYITNPWTGEQVRTTVQAVAQGVVDKSWEDASRKRVGGL